MPLLYTPARLSLRLTLVVDPSVWFITRDGVPLPFSLFLSLLPLSSSLLLLMSSSAII